MFKKYDTAVFFNMLVSKGLMYGENWRRKLTRTDIENIDVISYMKKTDYKMLVDNMGSCFYLSLVLLKYGHLFYRDFVKLYRYETGLEISGADLFSASERTNQLERAINSIRGHSKKDDSFTKRPEPDTWAGGIDLKKHGMLDEYYE